MQKKKHIIIGSGTAALSALKQIRQATTEDEIKMVSMESCLPYSPTSLPYVISGKIKESDIPLVEDGFFGRMNAAWERGRRVTGVDVEASEVVYGSRERERFDSLLIATGSEPVVPDIPGLKNGPFLQLRTLEDARVLMGKIERSRKAVILGAGLIGMHGAECLAEKGVQVTVLEMLPQVLPAYFDPDAARMIQSVLEQHGIAFVTGAKATGVEWKEHGVAVSLDRGEALEADILLVATGVAPRIGFLAGSAIRIDRGIVVDDEMRTNIPSVWAAGDVAMARGFLDGQHGANPILPNAAEQGKVAGSTMAGRKMAYEGWLPMNTFNFFGHLALSVGKAMASEGDEVLVENDGRGYKKLVCRDGRLVGASFVDVPVHAGVLQYLIRRKVEMEPYKQLLLGRPREAGVWLMQEAERRDTVPVEE